MLPDPGTMIADTQPRTEDIMMILVGSLLALMLLPLLILLGPFLIWWLLMPMAVLCGGAYLVGAFKKRHPPLASGHR